MENFVIQFLKKQEKFKVQKAESLENQVKRRIKICINVILYTKI